MLVGPQAQAQAGASARGVPRVRPPGRQQAARGGALAQVTEPWGGQSTASGRQRAAQAGGLESPEPEVVA